MRQTNSVTAPDRCPVCAGASTRRAGGGAHRVDIAQSRRPSDVLRSGRDGDAAPGGRTLKLIEVPAARGAYLCFTALRPCTPAADIPDIFCRALDAACQEGGLFQLLMHPHVTGCRIWILEEIIRHAKALGGAWFATHREIADFLTRSA